MEHIDFTYNYRLNLTKDEDINISKKSKNNVELIRKVKLIDVISNFNKQYLSFKKDYESMQKLGLSEREELIILNEKNNISKLVLGLCDPKDKEMFERRYATLYIYRSNNIIKSHVLDANKTKNIVLDYKKINRYFELLEEYKLLIEAYNIFKNEIKLSNSDSAFLGITNGDILDGLTTFDLTLITPGTCGMNIVELSYRLGYQFYLLGYGIQIDGKMIYDPKITNKVINHVLDKLYISKSALPDICKEKTKILKLK